MTQNLTAEALREALDSVRHPWFLTKEQTAIYGAALAYLEILEDDAQPTPEPESSIDICPSCGGPADNGFDRGYPPNAYACTKCDPEPVTEGDDDANPDIIYAWMLGGSKTEGAFSTISGNPSYYWSKYTRATKTNGDKAALDQAFQDIEEALQHVPDFNCTDNVRERNAYRGLEAIRKALGGGCDE